MTTPSDTDVLPLRTAAFYLNIGRKRMIHWVKEGRLPAEKRDGEYYFVRGDLFIFAHQYCIECGKEHWEVEEEVYFCPHCASAFAPRQTEQEFPIFGSFEKQRLQLFLMRMETDDLDDHEAAKRLQERFSMSVLRSYQVWFEQHHQKQGIFRVGLGVAF